MLNKKNSRTLFKKNYSTIYQHVIILLKSFGTQI